MARRESPVRARKNATATTPTSTFLPLATRRSSLRSCSLAFASFVSCERKEWHSVVADPKRRAKNGRERKEKKRVKNEEGIEVSAIYFLIYSSVCTVSLFSIYLNGFLISIYPASHCFAFRDVFRYGFYHYSSVAILFILFFFSFYYFFACCTFYATIMKNTIKWWIRWIQQHKLLAVKQLAKASTRAKETPSISQSCLNLPYSLIKFIFLIFFCCCSIVLRRFVSSIFSSWPLLFFRYFCIFVSFDWCVGLWINTRLFAWLSHVCISVSCCPMGVFCFIVCFPFLHYILLISPMIFTGRPFKVVESASSAFAFSSFVSSFRLSRRGWALSRRSWISALFEIVPSAYNTNKQRECGRAREKKRIGKMEKWRGRANLKTKKKWE